MSVFKQKQAIYVVLEHRQLRFRKNCLKGKYLYILFDGTRKNVLDIQITNYYASIARNESPFGAFVIFCIFHNQESPPSYIWVFMYNDFMVPFATISN